MFQACARQKNHCRDGSVGEEGRGKCSAVTAPTGRCVAVIAPTGRCVAVIAPTGSYVAVIAPAGRCAAVIAGRCAAGERDVRNVAEGALHP